MTFRWLADDGPTLNAGLVALRFEGIGISIARKLIFFVIFQVGSRLSAPLPLWIRACSSCIHIFKMDASLCSSADALRYYLITRNIIQVSTFRTFICKHLWPVSNKIFTAIITINAVSTAGLILLFLFCLI